MTFFQEVIDYLIWHHLGMKAKERNPHLRAIFKTYFSFQIQPSNLVRLHGDLGLFHRHLSNIDCLIARTACLVCFISAVYGRSKNEAALEDRHK
jgi:hypothetical protein